MGFSDRRIAELTRHRRSRDRAQRREARRHAGVQGRRYLRRGVPGLHAVPLFDLRGRGRSARLTIAARCMILGGGPNRIGQGIEFDYCCVHASLALKEDGFETIMVNCNPGDGLDRLRHFRSPVLRAADVRRRDRDCRAREARSGVIVQFGGQTPLKLAVPLERAGVPILGTSPDAIDRAEDRERFNALVEKLGLRQPRGILARGLDEAVRGADANRLPGADSALLRARRPRDGNRRGRSGPAPLRRAGAARLRATHPLLVDRYLDGAIEVDVDAISDGETRGHRRRDGAHRARRHPFGRQRLRAAAAHARRERAARIDASRRGCSRASSASSA